MPVHYFSRLTLIQKMIISFVASGLFMLAALIYSVTCMVSMHRVQEGIARNDLTAATVTISLHETILAQERLAGRYRILHQREFRELYERNAVKFIEGLEQLRRMSHESAVDVLERNLTGALDQLRVGKERQARDLLEKVVDGAPAIGVTDEALFRLALLSLKENEDNGFKRSQTLLERLADKYPDSLWTRQSAPLLSHLADVRTLHNRQRELKNLRQLNFSLSHDNRELRQSLEQLKQLDLELEQKIKR